MAQARVFEFVQDEDRLYYVEFDTVPSQLDPQKKHKNKTDKQKTEK